MSLKIEDLLAVNDREVVAVPAWGSKVFVRSLTAKEQLNLEARMRQAKDDDNYATKLAIQLSAYLSNEDGSQFATEEQAMKLIDKKPSTLQKIIAEAQKLNGWTDVEEEEIRKN
jgi:hypothetical protein